MAQVSQRALLYDKLLRKHLKRQWKNCPNQTPIERFRAYVFHYHLKRGTRSPDTLAWLKQNYPLP